MGATEASNLGAASPRAGVKDPITGSEGLTSPSAELEIALPIVLADVFGFLVLKVELERRSREAAVGSEILEDMNVWFEELQLVSDQRFNFAVISLE